MKFYAAPRIACRLLGLLNASILEKIQELHTVGYLYYFY